MKRNLFFLMTIIFALVANAKDSFTCVENNVAGNLSSIVNTDVMKLKIAGELNGTDINFLRTLINEHSLSSLDLSGARIVEGGEPYSVEGITHNTENDVFGDDMFRNCQNLSSIDLPTTITTIGCMALRGTGITSLTIPASVTTISMKEEDNGIVEECALLTEIIVEGGNPYYYSIDNVVFTEREDLVGEGGKALVMFPPGIGGSYVVPSDVTHICQRAFVSCNKLTNIFLPEGLAEIGHTAFWGCSSLTSISIPEGVTSIGHRAFQGCNFTSVTMKNSTPVSIESGVFSCYDNATLYVPFGCKDIYEGADCWSFFTVIEMSPQSSYITFADANVKALCVANWDINGDGELTYEEAAAVIDIGQLFMNSSITTFDELQFFTGLNNIPNEAFQGSSITSIIIPNHVTSIGEYAFFGATGIKTLVIPEGVEEIGNFAFYACQSLCSIQLPQTLTTLGEAVFRGDPLLTSVTIPKSVTQINGAPFWNCDGLVSITVEEGNPVYDSRNNCNAIIETATNTLVNGCKATVIPDDVEIIGTHAFCEQTALTAITIPCSVRKICFRAFWLTSLTEINIPEGVEEIDREAFSFIGSLTYVSLPSTLTRIDPCPFIRSVSRVVVADNNPIFDSRDNCNAVIETSTNKLVAGCRNTIIPKTVTSIGGYAFYELYNDNPYSITIPANVLTIEDGAFVQPHGGSIVNEVIVEHTSPITISGNVFSNRSDITLYVPAGSKAAYETSDYWKDFKEIVEYRETDQQENTLSVTTPSSMLTGRESSMSLNLKNEDEIIMMEFYLQLPEGISIADDEDGYPDVTINSLRNNKHSLDVVLGNDGLYHFVCYSSKNYALIGNDGELFHANLVVDENMAPGTYQGIIKNILMSDIDRNELTQVDYFFDITVMNVEMGDANGDGRINGLDIVDLVDFIMGRPSDDFVEVASDLTGDGIVNGMDLVKIVSLVLSQSAQSAPRRNLAPYVSHSSATVVPRLQILSSTEVQLGLMSSDEYILAQFIIEISDGEQLLDIESDLSHAALWESLGNGRYSVVVYSSRNAPFMSNETMACFRLSGECNITIKNMMVVDSYRQEHWFAGIREGTEIDNISDAPISPKTLIDLQGRKAHNKRVKGIYIVNGKKTISK